MTLTKNEIEALKSIHAGKCISFSEEIGRLLEAELVFVNALGYQLTGTGIAFLERIGLK